MTKSSHKTSNETSSSNHDMLVENMPMAKALIKEDIAFLAQILEAALPKSGVKVEDVKCKKSKGEAFTGGRSTPVYHITCQVVRPGNKTKRIQRNFVAKLVLMPGEETTASGDFDNSDEEKIVSDKLWMKRESYAVERRFYDCAAPRIKEYEPLMGGNLTIPKLLASDRDGSKPWPAVCFLMNDLSTTGFTSHPGFLSHCQAKWALRWIATFHCLFWSEQGDQDSDIWKRDLWSRGGHWTVKNREGQKHKISVNVSGIGQQWVQTVRWLESKHPAIVTSETKGLGKRIEAAAGPIADFLGSEASKGEISTLIHGDYKAANMFLSENVDNKDDDGGASNVAVLDFQFSGLGIGAEDVAYLLFPDALGDYFGFENELLECYYDELISQLMVQRKGGPSTLSFATFRAFYELSRIDILRHLLGRGWVGSTEGDATLVSALEETMNRLDGGSVFGSKEEYAGALSEFVAGKGKESNFLEY